MTFIAKSPAVFVPPLSLITCLLTCTTGWMSSFVTVHVFVSPTAIVALNRAVAVSMASGPEAGLAAIDELGTEPLVGYLYLPATRADLLRQLGRRSEAAAEYRAAIALADNATEREFLQRRLAEVTT